MEQVIALLERLKACKTDDDVNRVSMVRSFLYRHHQPIKERDHLAYQYEGTKDATREVFEQWRKEVMIERLKTLFQNDVDVDSTPLLAGYHVNNLLDKVC